MARKRRRSPQEDPDIPMTPMIDVVFQLLIFFLVTIKPMDITAHLDVYRPTLDKEQRDTPPPKMVKIVVFRDLYTVGLTGTTANDKVVTLDAMRTLLRPLADSNKMTSIAISCAPDSPHSRLIWALDVCAELGLSNISVTSLR